MPKSALVSAVDGNPASRVPHYRGIWLGAEVHRSFPWENGRAASRRRAEAGARIFDGAVAVQPDRAVLHYWLTISYARMADTSSLLFASKYSRKARLRLERADELDPRNGEYLRELFDFYLDSPGLSPGSLDRAAALLERISPDELSADLMKARLADSRKRQGSVVCWMWRAFLSAPGAVGYFVPQLHP